MNSRQYKPDTIPSKQTFNGRKLQKNRRKHLPKHLSFSIFTRESKGDWSCFISPEIIADIEDRAGFWL